MYRQPEHSDDLDYQLRQHRARQLGPAIKLLLTCGAVCAIGAAVAILLYVLYTVGVLNFSFA